MFLSILSIPVFLLLCSYTPVVHGICDEPEFTCTMYATYSICTINVDNGTRTSYLIEKCSGEIEQSGVPDIRFYVHLTEANGIITLNIPDGVTRFFLTLYDTMSVEFNETINDVQVLYLTALSGAVAYYPCDLLNYFPSLTYLEMFYGVFDCFPYLNSTILGELKLLFITLPDVVTIWPSMFVLPNLGRLALTQLEDAQWYRAIPSSFDNTRLYLLSLNGIQHLYSYQFANLPLLSNLNLFTFFTNFTFEENALSDLVVIDMTIRLSSPTDFDAFRQETFPSLTRLNLGVSSLATLDQIFFERQKLLDTLNAINNPFYCDCDMAWVSHVANNLSWTVTGTCATPSNLNGNLISDSSNYVNCSIQSFNCFNDTLICPLNSNCVSTADTAYCECIAGYTLNATNNLCADTNECIGTHNCEQNCINNIGSYTCSCDPGFTLQSDLLTCITSGVSQLTSSIYFAIVCLFLMSFLI